MTQAARHDIVIVGGGLVGASLAAALAGSQHQVALIETALPRAGEPSWDERCIALNAASRGIFESIGAWDAIAPAAEPITSTHISEQGRFGVARFNAPDAQLPALGYNVPVRALGAALMARLGSTSLLVPATTSRIEARDDRVLVECEAGGSVTQLETRLVVAADGANSAVRAMLGIEARERDYEQSAIVTAVRVSRAHGGCAYERFTPTGPIALLPKPQNACSLVWTVPAAQVEAMLAWSDDEFLARAQDAFGERLGRFTALGRRNAHPLAQVLARETTAPRVMLAGNAAQSLHPVAAQGFNLGLRDVAAIAGLVAGADDPGTPALLAEYRAQRARDRETVAGFTDGLIRTFSNRVPGLRGLRHLGLLALDLVPGLKSQVMWQNLGFGAGSRRS
jgi:2-octaprenyl-6-methoxyphenol hydroxylase